jgi:hypothetical protein
MGSETASVKVNYKTRELEISGGEEFVRATLEQLLQTFDSLAIPSEKDLPERDDDDDVAQDIGLGAYSQNVRFNKASAEESTIVFMHYLTKVASKPDVSADDILACYEQLGIAKPPNLSAVLNNLKHRAKQIVSTGRGRYKVNIAGENRVLRLTNRS